MRNYFFPSFKMKLLVSEEQEVRLAGENNFRRLLATYFVILTIIGVLALLLNNFNERLGGLALYMFGGSAFLIIRYVFIPARNPNYQREELHFRKGSIWNKISVGNKANGEIVPQYPLEVYVDGRHYRMYEPGHEDPLFEFELDFSDRDPLLLAKIASSLGVAVDFRLEEKGMKKYHLSPADKLHPKGFALREYYSEDMLISPNGYFQLELEPGGDVVYGWRSDPTLRPMKLRLLSEKRMLKVGSKKTIKIYKRKKLYCSHYLVKIERRKQRSHLELSFSLNQGSTSQKLFGKRFGIAIDKHKQRLDLVEDLEALEQDLAARLRAMVQAIPFNEGSLPQTNNGLISTM